MKWVRWRAHYASGVNRWEYESLYIEKNSKELEESVKYDMDARAEENSWSEHFRRIEWEIINHRKVPNIKIEEIHKNLLESIKSMKNSIKVKKENIILIERLSGKGSKTDPDEVAYAKRRKKMDAQLKKLEKERSAKK